VSYIRAESRGQVDIGAAVGSLIAGVILTIVVLYLFEALSTPSNIKNVLLIALGIADVADWLAFFIIITGIGKSGSV
jgi:uncharacterized membrane protein YkvI